MVVVLSQDFIEILHNPKCT